MYVAYVYSNFCIWVYTYVCACTCVCVCVCIRIIETKIACVCVYVCVYVSSNIIHLEKLNSHVSDSVWEFAQELANM